MSEKPKPTPEDAPHPSLGMGMKKDELPRPVLTYVENLERQIKELLGKHNLVPKDIRRDLATEELLGPKFASLRKVPKDYKKLEILVKLMERTVKTGEIPEEARGPESWDWKEGERVLLEGIKKFESEFDVIGDMAMSPDREHHAVEGVFESHHHFLALFVDKKPWDIKAAEIGAPIWNPDGQKLAAAIKDTSGRYYVAVNEQNYWDKEFERKIYGLAWSPDGKRLAAIHDSAQLLIDGKIFPERFYQLTVIAWNPDNVRVALAIRDEEGPEKVLVVNTESGAAEEYKFNNKIDGTEELAWSPDGRSLVLVAHVQDSNLGPGSKTAVFQEGRWHAPFQNCDYLSWSPDGQHVASSVRIISRFIPGQKLRSVCVDGMIWPQRFTQVGRPAWSPDNKRVAVSVQIERNRAAVVIDGKIVTDTFEQIEDNIQWNSDGSKILFAAIKDNKLLRVVKKV